MIRVALVDDHELIRRGLREVLGEGGEIRIVGEAFDYASMRAMLREVVCDVLVIDLNLPGRSGIEALESLCDDIAGTRAIVLSQYPEDQYGVRALKSGAMAYLNKSVEADVIIAAIKTVAAGRKYVTPQIAQALMDSVGSRSDAAPHERLSERELQTLRLIAAGQKLAEIASAMNLSPKTVSIYRARVLEKLALRGNAEIATYALRHRLID
jgi:two-component system, NarL family, invasion response regulator UvrY